MLAIMMVVVAVYQGMRDTAVNKAFWNFHVRQKINKLGGFPDGPVVKALHFWCKGRGFDPWLGNWDPHASEHVSLWATTAELMSHN